MPFTVLSVPINASAQGDQTLIAALPGYRHRLVQIMLQNLSAVDTTCLLKDGATALNGAGSLLSTKDSFVFDSTAEEAAFGWLLGINSALVLNLSAANLHGGFVRYYDERVQP